MVPSLSNVRYWYLSFGNSFVALSSELRVGCCQYSRAFLLWALLILAVSRRALVGSRAPMIWCLSNARSGDLQFGTSFIALRALVREIIPNTIPTYIHTWPKSDFHRLFDSGFAPSALSLRLNHHRWHYASSAIPLPNAPGTRQKW